MLKSAFSRFGLLPRLILSLFLVGVLPLATASIRLIQLNSEAMTSQVLRTHSLAARATAERISSELRPLISTLHNLAGNSTITDAPHSTASREMMSGALRSDSRILGLILINSAGETVIRVQHRKASKLLDETLSLTETGEALIRKFSDGEYLILDEGLEESDGFLRMVADTKALAACLDPEDLGEEAIIGLLSWEGPVFTSSSWNLQDFPSSMINSALKGKIAGAGRYPGSDGIVLGAFAPVPLSPWVVVSRQPIRVAEAAARRMKIQAAWTLGLVSCLVLLLIYFGYRNIVRPLRNLGDAQRKMAGLPDSPSGNEVQGLIESFRILQQRTKDRKSLGDVFLGRYLVIDVIGQGAMGTVFRGWDPKLERPVALKTIRPRGEGRQESRHLVSGLLREAVMAAGFSHPNIVSVFDVEDTPEAAFVAMEFIDGLSLGDYLALVGRLQTDSALHVGLAVAEALAAAHEHHIIHQDIKPGNILLGYDGAIKVVDFGISRTLSSALSSKELLFGTPGYLPPEALNGEGFDTRGDLFAMGVVLYYAISGHHPFLGPTLNDTYEKTISRPLRNVGEFLPDIDEGFRKMIMALISRDREDRPASAAGVAEFFRNLVLQGRLRWIPPERDKNIVSGVFHGETHIQIIPTDRLRHSPSGAFRN